MSENMEVWDWTNLTRYIKILFSNIMCLPLCSLTHFETRYSAASMLHWPSNQPEWDASAALLKPVTTMTSPGELELRQHASREPKSQPNQEPAKKITETRHASTLSNLLPRSLEDFACKHLRLATCAIAFKPKSINESSLPLNFSDYPRDKVFKPPSSFCKSTGADSCFELCSWAEFISRPHSRPTWKPTGLSHGRRRQHLHTP